MVYFARRVYPTDQTAELPARETSQSAANDGGATPPGALAATGDPDPDEPGDNLVETAPLPDSQAKQGSTTTTRWSVGRLVADRYFLERRLGGGAMGEVFLARDRLLKKQVALKVLRADLAENRNTVRRFLREVALAHSVTHPSVVRIYDTGEAQGLPYFSMEYLQGQTLDELVNRDTIPTMTLREIRDLGLEILSGLEAAHQAGVIHRDLKPANVMLTHRGAIVMDFGVAGLGAPEERPDPADVGSLIKTEAGTIFGSPAYMAPELWEGTPASVESDLYSFGVMMYQLLSGRLPIDAPNAQAFLEKLRREKPIPIRNVRRGIPLRMARLVTRCMDHDPENRPSTAQAAENMLLPLTSSRRRRFLYGALAATAVCGTAVAFVMRGGPTHVAMGLPDALAVDDLEAAVRSWDVGDHETALRQLDRLSVRAPQSAAVTFWRATVERDRGDESGRVIACSDAESLVGSEQWIDVARSACGASFALGEPLIETLNDKTGGFDDAYLPIAISTSVLPRLEAAHSTNLEVFDEAQRLLERLDDEPQFRGAAAPVRWALASFELEVSLGQTDQALARIETLLDRYPESDLVKARAAWLLDQLGQTERALAIAEQIAPHDPRPLARHKMGLGRMEDAWSDIEAHDGAYQQALVDMWCGYAFRFETDLIPERCEAMGDGLARALWSPLGVDPDPLTPLERDIVATQAVLNLGDCRAQERPPFALLSHACPPFETYGAQLHISGQLCAGDTTNARTGTQSLLAVTPQDPWALLLEAQADESAGLYELADRKRAVVAATWKDADPDLPLVSRLQQRVNPPPPDEAADEPADGPADEEPTQPDE